MNYYIGIDLGGTNVRVVKVDEKGDIIQDVIAPSHGTEGPEKIEENILELLRQFDLSDVKSIGFAIPGPVDGKRNVITQATNIPGCENYPFAEHIQEVTNLPVFLDNDANAAGLAEAILGSGKGYHIVYYLTHSTGIGGGLIIDGKIISGHKGYAGEVANVIVDPDAKQYPIYKHLNRGGVETVASGTAIGLIGKELIGDEADSSRKVFVLASEGNETAKAIIDKGVFATALYDLKSAYKAGKESTGNGFRGGSSVSEMPTNLIVEAGDKSFDELLEEAGEGIILTDLSGLHAGVNSISGDFSLLCEGYLIENGKKGRPVEQITVAGNFYDVIKSIKSVGNDIINLPSGEGEFFTPSVLVSSLAISGDEE